MIAILQWTVLAACLACTAWRIPALLKGRNRGLFWTFALASISVALSIPTLYMPIDELLGGENVANVILRLSLFAVFFLLATKVAAAYNSPFALRLIRGPAGLTALIVSTLGVLITYSLADLTGSNTGLVDFGGQPYVTAYMWFGVGYTAYAAATLVLPTARAALTKGRPLDRTAAACLCVGFFLVCITVPLQLTPTGHGTLHKYASFGSILAVTAGLTLIWLSFIRRPMPENLQS